MTGAGNNIDYKILFETSPLLFIVLKPNSPEYTVINANDAYLAATNKTREEVSGKSIFSIFPDNPDDPATKGIASLRTSLDLVVEKKVPDNVPALRYDVQITTPQGIVFDEKYWLSKNTPILDDDQAILYIIRQVEDVTAIVQTEKKHLENARVVAEELEQKSVLLKENKDRINLLLEALLKFTTLDFSERLVISDKGDELDAIAFGLNSLVDELENQVELLKRFNNELEEANMELDSFSYSVSHDLRSPLRAISGYSQILLEDYAEKLGDDGKKLIGIVMKNSSKMGSLIDDLLTFSRAGKQNLSTVPLNMNNSLESVIRDLTGLQKDDKTEFKIAPLENAQGDSSMIKQVLTNLISNAIKYSGKKEKPIIEIGSYTENNMAIYYVKDNGAGFDMKYYDKLFGVFQRLHSAADFEGTGVGLALVDRIVKKHQGRVWAEGVPGEGATFYFSLPI